MTKANLAKAVKLLAPSAKYKPVCSVTSGCSTCGHARNLRMVLAILKRG